MDIFQSNAAELEKLRDRVHETFQRRGESPERMAAWQEAAQAFQTSYDNLAFPGGLNRELALLKLGNPEAIEMAIRFLEANPLYFRSGYFKADALRLLNRQPLTDDQCTRLRKVILDRVQGLPVREIRAYCRVAPKVSNPQFEIELSNIAKNAGGDAARHAGWVLEYLNRARNNC